LSVRTSGDIVYLGPLEQGDKFTSNFSGSNYAKIKPLETIEELNEEKYAAVH
jgi:hypothetical protein